MKRFGFVIGLLLGICLTLFLGTEYLVHVRSGWRIDNGMFTSADIDTPDIDGGTIDSCPIGGSTPAAVASTTLNASGAATLQSTLAVTGNTTLSADVDVNNLDLTGGPVIPDQNSVTTSVALMTWGATDVNSAGGALALTLADPAGGTSAVGQLKMVSMSTAGNNADLTIAHHETADDEVARFDAADEYLLLVWTGTEWATVSNSCTFP